MYHLSYLLGLLQKYLPKNILPVHRCSMHAVIEKIIYQCMHQIKSLFKTEFYLLEIMLGKFIGYP